MRILHTSDWHLGATFHEQDREREEELVLEAVIDIAKREQVDAVVIAGDVFDSVNPPAAAMARYYSTLLRLQRDAGVGSVLVIGGNHDHGLRLDGPKALLTGMNLHIRGQLPRDAEATSVVVPIVGRAGTVVGRAALVPYLREADVTLPQAGTGLPDLAERQAHGMRQRFTEVNQALLAQAGELPCLAVTHAFASGGALGSMERPVMGETIIGRLGRCDVSPLAAGCGYLALGHLHRPQKVGGQNHWRYCGSLLPMAMDETESPRQVLIVDMLATGVPAVVREVVLPQVRAYQRLSGGLATVRLAIAELERPAAEALVPWCDVRLNDEACAVAMVRDLEERIAQRGWRSLRICRDKMRTSAAGTAGASSVRDLQQLTPEEVLLSVLATQGRQATPELLADFAHLCQDVLAEES